MADLHENQESIAKWIDDVFPGGDPKSPRKSLRALEEMVELCIADGANPSEIAKACRAKIHEGIPQFTSGDWETSIPNPAGIPAKAADVVIVLYGLAALNGFDLQAEIDRKMAINRYQGKWIARGDGTGYHIKGGSE